MAKSWAARSQITFESCWNIPNFPNWATVNESVIYRKPHVLLLRQALQFPRLPQRRGHRLFYEHVFAAFDCSSAKCVVAVERSGDNDCVNTLVRKQYRPRAIYGHARLPPCSNLESLWDLIRNRC